MVDPQVIIKANYNRTLLTIRVTAINSPDWVDIVGTKIELFRDWQFSNRFYQNTTYHYKVRAYLENETPDRTIYGKITLTKSDNTTHESTFSFVVPFPVLGTVKDENGMKYITSMRKMDKNGNLSPRNYANKAVDDTPPYIDIMADEGGEMVVGNQWTTPIMVENVTQGTTPVSVAANASSAIAVSQGDVVRVTESTADTTFRTFADNTIPLCKGVSAHITVMPSMDRFTTGYDNTYFGTNFFTSFNNGGTLTSLPEGSFDIHKIRHFYNPSTGTNKGIFRSFNQSGALTSLPEGSFDTSSWTSTGDVGGHFTYFNAYGALTSLPEGSFDFDSLKYTTSSGASITFDGFNKNGALTTLPEGSFGFSRWEGILPTLPGFNYFNQNGNLISLPAGSFHFKKGYIVERGFSFRGFNQSGRLTSLPEHSFNFKIGNVIGSYGFDYFNKGGALTSLPAGSFQLDASCTQIPYDCFKSFNEGGALTSLPEGSFNFDNLTYAGGFEWFNKNGALTSLPEGSFNFDNVTAVGSYGFSEFNASGALKSLPKGSFSFNSLTTVNTKSFSSFNSKGALEYLPINSFNMDDVTTYGSQAPDYPPFDSFNYRGKLTKSETDYNPNFIVPTPQTRTQTAYYYDTSTETWFSETLSTSNPFKYYQADYFTVTYVQSPAYTTNLASTYLSGQTITFTATAADPEYLAVPTITTAGGITVAVTDNGDDTYTFVMPQDDIDVTFAVSLRPAVITLVAEEAGTMKVLNKWTTPVLVKNETQGTPAETVVSQNYADVPVAVDDVVTVTEGTANSTFRNWNNYSDGLATKVLCRISEMPPINRFTQSSNNTRAGNYFFRYFCACGTDGKGITSLPAGSFDTSEIQYVNADFFYGFNTQGQLTSLPTGSFNISNISGSISSNFFGYFNNKGKLTYLPDGSFDTSNITQTSNHFFTGFNAGGELTSLPVGSFDTSNVTQTGSSFFNAFNDSGKLVSLPAGSFDTSNITSVGEYFFTNFNRSGALTSLPTGSFNISNISTISSGGFFSGFNYYGALTSLPDGSFILNSTLTSLPYSSFGNFNGGSSSKHGMLTSLPAGSFNTDNLTSLGGSVFAGFNHYGNLTSLPTGSFNISNLTTMGSDTFHDFNLSGALTSLPAGSFNLGNITVAESNIFSAFNSSGALTSLPAGSFNTDNLTTIKGNCFANFNYKGQLTSLPAGSFNLSNITTITGTGFMGNFNANGGYIPKDDTAGNYNPNFINPTSEDMSAYYRISGGGSSVATIAPGAPFYYKTV